MIISCKACLRYDIINYPYLYEGEEDCGVISMQIFFYKYFCNCNRPPYEVIKVKMITGLNSVSCL